MSEKVIPALVTYHSSLVTVPMNLLIIQTAFIGDVVLLTPLLQAVREKIDVAQMTIVVRPDTAGLLRNHPAVDDVVSFDKKGKDRGIRGLLRLGRQLREKRFDTVLIPHRSLRSVLLARLAGVPVRVGFDTSAGRRLLTQRMPYQTVHEVERNLSLLHPWTTDTNGYSPALYPDETDRAAVDELLKNNDIMPDETLFGICPGSVWATKRWLPDRFAGTIKRLHDDHIGRAVLFGGSDDEGLCRDIADRSGVSPVIAAGRLSLLQSAALAARCTVMLSNDTGMAHIAAAMNTPVIALFGPTVPALGFTPYGSGHQIIEQPLSCRPCGTHGGPKCPIGTHACMQDITTDQVMQTITAMLHPKP